MTKQRRPFCEDWACPAMWTCARAWGRSEAYWRFDPEADAREGVQLYGGARKPGHADCADWERDVARPWLSDAFEPLDGKGFSRPQMPDGFALPTVDCAGRA